MKNESGSSPQVGYEVILTCALYAVVAHLLLGFLVQVGVGCWRAADPGEFIVQVLASPKLYFFVVLYGFGAWVALIFLAYAARKLFTRRWARYAFVLIVFCYWRPFLSLIGCVMGTESFVLHWLWAFPLVLGWSPAIFLWLLYRQEKQQGTGQRHQANVV